MPTALLRRLLACAAVRIAASRFCRTANCSHQLTTAAQNSFAPRKPGNAAAECDGESSLRRRGQDWWHPGRRRTESSLFEAELERVGGAGGEAGKPLCDPAQLFHTVPSRLSVGSNGDAAFEADVLERAPSPRRDIRWHTGW